jgi:hypothetical protein
LGFSLRELAGAGWEQRTIINEQLAILVEDVHMGLRLPFSGLRFQLICSSCFMNHGISMDLIVTGALYPLFSFPSGLTRIAIGG